MKNFAFATLAVVTLTIFAGDARAQSGFLGLGNWLPFSSSYGSSYSQGTCTNGRCGTPTYPSTYGTTSYYGNTGHYNNYPAQYNNTPSHYGYGTGTGYGSWVNPAYGNTSNCTNGRCATPAYRPTTTYPTAPYSPGSYYGSQFNTNYNNRTAPYYGSY